MRRNNELILDQFITRDVADELKNWALSFTSIGSCFSDPTPGVSQTPPWCLRGTLWVPLGTMGAMGSHWGWGRSAQPPVQP